MKEDPQVILKEYNLPMDAYNVVMRRYQDNLGRV